MEDQIVQKHNHHLCTLVAYAPLVGFVVSIISFILHLWFPIKLGDFEYFPWIGFLFIIVFPIFIFWSQKHRIDLYRLPAEHHKLGMGPYIASRHPTYVGVLGLILGLSFLLNSFTVIVGAFVTFFIFHFFIIPWEEKLLCIHIGQRYCEYQKEVRMWL